MRLTGVVLSLLMAGCAVVEHAPPGSIAKGEEAAPAPVPAAAPAPAPAAAPAAVPQQEQPGKPVVATGPQAAKPPAKPPAKPSPRPPVTPSAKPPASPTAGPPQQSAPAPAQTKEPVAPALDLATLEARLRETDAIGMFTKIALKNQVEDLLDQFREYYAGKARTSLSELRPAYDRLLMKVLALLQDDDPDLARAIVDSREPIWGILSDPNRFATL